LGHATDEGLQRIAFRTFEKVSSQKTVYFHMPKDRFNRIARRKARFWAHVTTRYFRLMSTSVFVAMPCPNSLDRPQSAGGAFRSTAPLGQIAQPAYAHHTDSPPVPAAPHKITGLRGSHPPPVSPSPAVPHPATSAPLSQQCSYVRFKGFFGVNPQRFRYSPTVRIDKVIPKRRFMSSWTA